MPLPNHHPSYLEKDHITVVGSRSHASDEVIRFVDQLKAAGKEVNFMSKGSSLKFCMVARGDADVYPRFGPTMEWDTAAADIIAECCGRKVKQWPSMLPMIYNKPQLLNPWFIVD